MARVSSEEAPAERRERRVVGVGEAQLRVRRTEGRQVGPLERAAAAASCAANKPEYTARWSSAPPSSASMPSAKRSPATRLPEAQAGYQGAAGRELAAGARPRGPRAQRGPRRPAGTAPSGGDARARQKSGQVLPPRPRDAPARFGGGAGEAARDPKQTSRVSWGRPRPEGDPAAAVRGPT